MAEIQDRDAAEIRRMFGRISGRYDLLNQILSLGQYRCWIDRVASLVTSEPGGRVLDSGTGTGRLAKTIQKNYPGLTVVGGDFCRPMLEQARRSGCPEQLQLIQADGLELPFPDESFACVTCSYLLRNVDGLRRFLAEQRRLLEPGGQFIGLETAPPSGPAASVVSAYLKFVLPLAGRLFAGSGEAYRYLGESTRDFLGPGELVELLRKSGFDVVRVEKRMLGTQTIFEARKR